MKGLIQKAANIFSNRIIMLTVILSCLFLKLCTQLYEIQIVNARDYQAPSKKVYASTRIVPAPRGEIFDRNGQPLAINHSTVMVKIDTNVKVSDYNKVLISFVRLMARNGETIIDDLPISDSEPREYLFNGSAAREKRWIADMDLPEGISAQDAYDRLVNNKFKIPVEEEGLTDLETRTVLALRQSVYLQRFRLNPVTAAIGVSGITCAALEERNQEYPGFYIDVDYLREYPEGEYVSHIIGYIRKINSDQLKELESFGYSADDIVGQLGIEKSFEMNLRGEDGKVRIEVDQTGRRLGVLSDEPAVAGSDVYLTLDINLQKEVYNILERQLTQVIIGKLKADPNRRDLKPEDYISARSLLVSMLKAGNISAKMIMESGEGSLSLPVRQFVHLYGGLNPEDEDYNENLEEFIAEGLEKGRITENQMLLVMYEQGIIAPAEPELAQMKNGTLPVLSFIIRMLDEGVITPQMTNVHPCTGSIVVVDVNTGGILASVSYPSYDNNEFVNTFNNSYYRKLMSDPTLPMNNRPFQEMRAVGSTFKMITAVAGLEFNAVTVNTKITDEYTFTKAGRPYAKCTIRHGSINIVDAIMHSCNYYFYETAYRLGNTKENTKLEGIAKLNEYMMYFGLGSPTGVEIYEIYDTLIEKLPEGIFPISSPEYRSFKQKTASSRLWSDGDSIRTGIGQADNNLTAATMAKYVATLAADGVRYQLHFLDRIQSFNGTLIKQFTPVVEEIVPMSESTLDAIRQGMLAVTSNTKGTANKIFKDFPVPVAGKTGTAQEANFPNHLTFAGFAPYDDPQVAVYVLMPGSYQSSVAHPATAVAKDVLAAYFRISAEPQKPAKANALAY